jgi:hypothetical protein
MKWVSVKERLPDVYYQNPNFSVNVLVTDGKMYAGELTCRIASYNFSGQYWSYPEFEVEYWMPLPTYPETPSPLWAGDEDMREAFNQGKDFESMPHKYDDFDKWLTYYKKTKS